MAENSSNYDYLFKVVLIGDSGVGKSYVRLRLAFTVGSSRVRWRGAAQHRASQAGGPVGHAQCSRDVSWTVGLSAMQAPTARLASGSRTRSGKSSRASSFRALWIDLKADSRDLASFLNLASLVATVRTTPSPRPLPDDRV